jgi:hypothetical protein
MGIGPPLPRGKTRPGRDADHSPHSVPRSRMNRTYFSSSPCRLHGGSGTDLLYNAIKTGDGVSVYLHIFLTSELHGGGCLASLPAAFPWTKSPGYLDTKVCRHQNRFEQLGKEVKVLERTNPPTILTVGRKAYICYRIWKWHFTTIQGIHVIRMASKKLYLQIDSKFIKANTQMEIQEIK